MIVAEGMMPVAVGTLAGVAASFAVNRILQSQLVGVSPYDPLTLSIAPVVLIAIALVGLSRSGPPRHARRPSRRAQTRMTVVRSL